MNKTILFLFFIVLINLNVAIDEPAEKLEVVESVFKINKQISETIRLVGNSSHSGRLEVFYNGDWGTVCDDMFTMNAANVVCRQLGFSEAVSWTSGFSFTTGPIFLDDVICEGHEYSIEECDHLPYTNHNCVHAEDVYVSCRTEESQQIRLGPGGAVEIFYNNEWGTICDDHFSNQAADVVCRQLGFTNSLSWRSRYNSGISTNLTAIHLDDIICSGYEYNLNDCSHSQFGSHNCAHSEDVLVTCNGSGSEIEEEEEEIEHEEEIESPYPHPIPTAAPLPIRLSEGGNSGRVEVYYNGNWGTVCDDSFTYESANVVCRQLGFDYASSWTSGLSAPSFLPILLDDVVCTGSEINIESCSHRNFGEHNCVHQEDVHVTCEILQPCEPLPLEIRLTGGSSNSGRLEVLSTTGSWGTVCDDMFTIEAANVACRQLGFPSAANWTSGVNPGYNHPILLDNLVCTGNEYQIQSCSHQGEGIHDCSHHEDVSITCLTYDYFSPTPTQTPTPTPFPSINNNYPVRLIGNSSSSGRLEILFENTWGTVCDDLFNIYAAHIACRQLGFFAAVNWTSGISLNETNRAILLDDVVCQGYETDISQCSHSSFGVHNCNHFEDVYITCSSEYPVPNYVAIRLNGDSPVAGRLEVLYNDQWGTVCDDSFGQEAANVACRQLGFGQASTFYTSTGNANLPILLDNVVCTGTEYSLEHCSHAGWRQHDCSHEEDIYLVCESSAPINVRLVSAFGEPSNSGIVQVSYNGQWGNVCDDWFDLNAANVVCRQLGYPGAAATTSVYGEESFLLDDVICTGGEASISQCHHRAFGEHDCSAFETAHVTCQSNYDGQIRLGQNNILEVYYNGIWGTVCDDGFSVESANVACRQLGFTHMTSFVSANYEYPALGPILLDDVMCSGIESSITECSRSDFGQHNCVHSEDVILYCSNEPETGSIRLASGTEGFLEVYYNGQWGTVCDDGFSAQAAHVACRELGFVGSSNWITATGDWSSPILLDDVVCYGQEQSIFECRSSPLGSSDCTHEEDVYLYCSNDSLRQEGDIQLIGDEYGSGRLEIYHSGVWGTVCDDGFDRHAADVACRQLGFFGAESYDTRYGDIADVMMPIHLDDISCFGYETSLLECYHNPFGDHDCSHIEDVYITCTVDYPQKEEKKGLKPGGIIAVSVSCGFIAVASALICCLWKKKKISVATATATATTVANVEPTGINTEIVVSSQTSVPQTTASVVAVTFTISAIPIIADDAEMKL